MGGFQVKEFVFIHVPRCGGGSVAEATTSLGGKYDPVNRDTDENGEYFYEGHRNSDLLKGAFSFSFIRNPLDKSKNKNKLRGKKLA